MVTLMDVVYGQRHARHARHARALHMSLMDGMILGVYRQLCRSKTMKESIVSIAMGPGSGEVISCETVRSWERDICGKCHEPLKQTRAWLVSSCLSAAYS